MFHVQVRQFPHLARAFNLTREQLDTTVLHPWVAGRPVRLQERHWEPGRARLTVLEGPELRPEEIGLGRGWANATRSGTDVTAALLGASGARTEELKERIAASCATAPLALRDAVALAGPYEARASAQLALAEQAVWELLHAGVVRLARGEEVLAADRWEPTLLSWSAWQDDGLVVESSAAAHATTSAINRSRSGAEANR